MKKIITILTAVLITAGVFAQAPQLMSYQAVIRNSNNVLITDSPVGMKISIRQGSSTGSPVYVETDTSTTNANGLVTLAIGSGTPVTGTFSGINWANGPYYIETETDPTGGTNYTITGTSQLLSVPYALYAQSVSDTNYYTKTELQTPGQSQVNWNNITNQPPYIVNTANPPASGDILFYNGSSWSLLSPAINGEVLTLINGLPAWKPAPCDTILVTTLPISNLSLTYATCGGTVASTGGSNNINRGICWSPVHQPPTIADSLVSAGTGTGSFTGTINGLIAGHTYYVRAYAYSNCDTVYGSQVTFTTLTTDSCPTLTTTAASGITQTSAKSGGNITASGGDSVTARGICYGIDQNPYIPRDSVIPAGSDIGEFAPTMNNLTCGTKYYVRAYATNSAGTCYGTEISFTTSEDIPIVSTDSVDSISAVGGMSGGIISATCGCAITDKGIYWSKVHSSNLSDGNQISSGIGQSPYNASIVTASPGVTYYVQAYATNCNGTALGQVVSFTTLNNETCFDFENGVTPAGWIGTWSVDTPGFQSNYSLRSAYAITSQVTDTITTGSGQVTFYYTFSNWEEGPSCGGVYATIQFYIDNVLVDTYTNDDTGNWYEGTGNISNSSNHTFKWVYNPQETCAGLTGYGYIDDVCYPK